MKKFILCFLMFSVISAEAASISWSPPITGGSPETYTIYYTNDGVTLLEREVGSVTYLDNIVDELDLSPNTHYMFEVSASNAAGEGERSEPIGWTTPTILEVPGKPVHLIIE